MTSGYYIPLWPNVPPISGQTSTVIKPMRRMIRQLCRGVGGVMTSCAPFSYLVILNIQWSCLASILEVQAMHCSKLTVNSTPLQSTQHTHTSRTINYDNIYYCDVYYICTGHTTPAAQYRAIPPPIRDRQVTSALRTEQPVFLLSCTFGFFKDFQMDFSTQPNLIWIESVEEVGWLEHN